MCLDAVKIMDHNRDSEDLLANTVSVELPQLLAPLSVLLGFQWIPVRLSIAMSL